MIFLPMWQKKNALRNYMTWKNIMLNEASFKTKAYFEAMARTIEVPMIFMW
jgi:hypothetical protein